MPMPRNSTSDGSRRRPASSEAARPAVRSAPATRTNWPSAMAEPCQARRGCGVRVRSGARGGAVERVEDSLDGDLDVEAAQLDVRCDGRLVRIVDPGEARQLAGLRARVEALGIAFLAHLDGRVDVHLYEAQAVALVRLARVRARLRVGRDDGDERDQAGVGEQSRDHGGAAHVAVAVLGGEAEVAADAVAQVVAVEPVGGAA